MADGPKQQKKGPEGLEVRHSRTCPRLHDPEARCRCKPGPSYRAVVWHKRTKTVERRTFSGPGALAEAKLWRANVIAQQPRGRNAPPTRKTLEEAANEWLAGAQAQPPTILTRGSEQPFKPSTLRGYESDLRTYIIPELGGMRLADVRRGDLQRLVSRLIGEGHSASKIRNIVTAARVVFRHAAEHDEIAISPTTGLRLPSGGAPRERAASPMEAADLIAALPLEDRALWACAFYAGLRRGELRALRWSDVDLAGNVISVHRSWDDLEGEIAPKSAKGTRTVPIRALLHDHLAELKARTDRDGDDFVFGLAPNRPFTPAYVRKRAAAAWKAANVKRIENNLERLEPIGLHEARHTCVSILADAGVPLERIGDIIGHSTVYMVDKYRHKLAGADDETRRMMDQYDARADTRARIEQLDREEDDGMGS